MLGSGWVAATGLPNAPLDAAAAFHVEIVPEIRAAIARTTDLVVCFDPVEPSHRAWRLAAIQELAREAAPSCRVNGLVIQEANPGGNAEAMQFLHSAPGVTGQVLEVDGNSPPSGYMQGQ